VGTPALFFYVLRCINTYIVNVLISLDCIRTQQPALSWLANAVQARFERAFVGQNDYLDFIFQVVGPTGQ
jgi:hypothetical protein